jgi:hypothetical protein
MYVCTYIYRIQNFSTSVCPSRSVVSVMNIDNERALCISKKAILFRVENT